MNSYRELDLARKEAERMREYGWKVEIFTVEGNVKTYELYGRRRSSRT
ncbi:MAG TPA: hypothetical protein VM050_01540 [Patescibacteria group bacterium]|nr:hypothetical protein [Patescibacteria group bacterium]